MEKLKFYSLWLCLICVIIFVLQVFVKGFTDIFILSANALSKPWQFLTAIFLHGSIVHLLYNIFALLFFGLILEKLIGSKKFSLLFIFSGLFANLVSFFWYPNSLGASGAIMAIIGALAVLKPMMAVWAFGLILPMFVLAIIWIIGSFLGIFGFGEQNIGHLTHLSGILIGVLYGFFLRLKAKYNKHKIGYTSRIVIPESYIQQWENYYLKTDY